MNNIIRIINNPLIVLKFIWMKTGKIISNDELYLRILYFLSTKKCLKLNPPVTFNEKLQWLKLYDRKPEYTQMVDKYEVRKYIAKKIGKDYLIPLLGVWDNADEIDFEKLPEQFVLKCTHDSGSVFICKNKENLNVELTKKKLKKALKKNYYYQGREYPYKNLIPKIIAEKYIEDGSGQLKDYKILCFNGEPKAIQVDFDRFNGHKRNLYDTNWKYLPFRFLYPTHPEIQIPKPQNLDLMLSLANKLSAGIPHIRVDFYESAIGGILFGELTFFHGSGFEPFNPPEWDKKLGDWLYLENIVNNK